MVLTALICLPHGWRWTVHPAVLVETMGGGEVLGEGLVRGWDGDCRDRMWGWALHVQPSGYGLSSSTDWEGGIQGWRLVVNAWIPTS